MKKTIKQALIISSAIFCMTITSCKKEAGPQGEPGTPGVNGNANVTQISFGSTVLTNSVGLTLPGIDKATAEKSMILAYGKASNGLWYQLPGFSISGTSEYRMFLTAQDPASILTISRFSGPGETFSAIRVLVIPANNLVNGRNSNPPYDISDYESVRAYFNLP